MNGPLTPRKRASGLRSILTLSIVTFRLKLKLRVNIMYLFFSSLMINRCCVPIVLKNNQIPVKIPQSRRWCCCSNRVHTRAQILWAHPSSERVLEGEHSAKLEDLRLSHILLSNFQSKELIYHKDEVLKHLCKKWDNELINNMELICKEDVYRVDGEERKEEMMSFVNTFDAIQSTIFSRMSRRLQNTQIADYLHGHCLRFQDFAFSVEKANKSLFAPICIECGILPDSPYHQLMECTSFDSTYRSNIMEDLASYETNFHIPLLFNKINDMNMLSALRSVGIYGNADLFTDASVIRDNFCKQVELICCTSSFSDQILS